MYSLLIYILRLHVRLSSFRCFFLALANLFHFFFSTFFRSFSVHFVEFAVCGFVFESSPSFVFSMIQGNSSRHLLILNQTTLAGALPPKRETRNTAPPLLSRPRFSLFFVFSSFSSVSSSKASLEKFRSFSLRRIDFSFWGQKVLSRFIIRLLINSQRQDAISSLSHTIYQMPKNDR